MAPKNLVLLAALLIVVISAGQVPGSAGLGTTTNTSALISGVVPCAAGNSTNLAKVPVFRNAAVQLVCAASKVVASTTTDINGLFVFKLPGLTKDLVMSLLSNRCNVVVVTPLGACDKSLAGSAGTLSAPLKLLGLDTGSGSGSVLDLGGIIGLITQIIGGLIGGILNLGTQTFSLV